MKEFAEFLLERTEFLVEKAAPRGRHLTHLEDLPFQTGDEGIEHAANILDDLNTMLSGKQKASFNAPKAKSFVAGKFDGAPAIIFGRDPETKKFFVASKSAFNKAPKINYTMEDIERNHGDNPGLADKLREALIYLPTVAPKKGVYQGDFMYDRWTIKKSEKYHEYTPNTITYRVKANSEEGRKAFRAKFGIVVHTKYEGKSLGDLQPTPYVDTESFGENPDVHLIPAKVEMNPENWSPKDRADFTNELENAKIKYKRMKPEAFEEIVKHADLLDLYFNETVRGKTKPDVEGYIGFLTRRAEKDAKQYSTPARQESVRRKYAELIQHVQNGQKHFKDAFELHDHLQKAKNVLMNGIRQNTPDYEYYINGKKTGPEGYVVYRDGQPAVKLVNRKEFSKMNFELAKMRKPTYPLPAIPPVVFAFGRMNPPTGGHEVVVNKVKELANEYGAAHDIVMSATNEPKKNPLTPEQKEKYAKKFFPGVNIHSAEKETSNFLEHAARLYAAGHKELIMVAGPDRAEHFRKWLAAYNGKPGKHGYYKFNHIKVVTSERLPGKSGTEMRGYVQQGDFDSFKQGLPKGVKDTDAKHLFNDVKKGLNKQPLKEEKWVELNEETLDETKARRWYHGTKSWDKIQKAGYMIPHEGDNHEIANQFTVNKDSARDYSTGASKRKGDVISIAHKDLRRFKHKIYSDIPRGMRKKFGLTHKKHPYNADAMVYDKIPVKYLTKEPLDESLSRSFLHKYKNLGRRFAPQTECDPEGTSAGACAVTSYALHKRLKNRGHDSHIVVGHYDDKGRHPRTVKKGMDINHAWVVSGGKIHDVTHNQFGPRQSGETGWQGLPVGPAIVKTNTNDPRYREYARDDVAIKHMRAWPTEQRPTKRNLRQIGVREERQCGGNSGNEN